MDEKKIVLKFLVSFIIKINIFHLCKIEILNKIITIIYYSDS